MKRSLQTWIEQLLGAHAHVLPHSHCNRVPGRTRPEEPLDALSRGAQGSRFESHETTFCLISPKNVFLNSFLSLENLPPGNGKIPPSKLRLIVSVARNKQKNSAILEEFGSGPC